MAKKSRVILFGAGLVGRQALPRYQGKASVIAFADNDVRKLGKQILGVTVIHPDRISSMDYDEVVITSTSSGQIFDQLIELGISQSKIKIAGESDDLLKRRFPWDAVLFLAFIIIVVFSIVAGLLVWLFV